MSPQPDPPTASPPRRSKAAQRATSRKDRTTLYARRVVSGKIIAGPHVRAACQRHLTDLVEGPNRGLRWDREAAELAIDFYPDVLRLAGGEFEGQPFELALWQAFIIGNLYGWKQAESGLRRFRVAYVETAKGSGKSPLAAGVGLKGLVADGEARAEVYSAATKKDQAMILFRDAVAMVKQSAELQSRCVLSGSAGNEWNIAYHKTGSWFRPVANDDGKSGPRPHVALIDELHEHKDADAIEMMRAGFKHRRQPLLFVITNSGASKYSVCWDYHEYATKVCAGTLIDDSLFGYVCALDEEDDPFKDERCWIKVNPSLPALPGMQYLRDQVTAARGIPAKESLVKRLNFCVWTEAESPWLSSHIWLNAKREIDPESLRGRRCFAGLDLSSTTDLTALVLLFEPEREADPWILLPRFWLPGDGLGEKADKDRVPYLAWRDSGHLQALQGRAVDKRGVMRDLVQASAQFNVVSIAYDRWRIEDLKMLLADEGIDLPLVPFGQGFKDMGPAVDEFERRLLNNQLVHNGNPVLTWCAANAVINQDPAGNRKLDKERSNGRIDGMVAAVMAIGASLSPTEEPQPIPGIIVL